MKLKIRDIAPSTYVKEKEGEKEVIRKCLIFSNENKLKCLIVTKFDIKNYLGLINI